VFAFRKSKHHRNKELLSVRRKIEPLYWKGKKAKKIMTQRVG